MEYLKPEDLAAEVQVPVKTVYVWNLKGTGPRVTRIGKHVRYSRVDVDDWLASRRDDAGRAK
jgi:predicted DNA-binding transcriptional regulator AlpA